MYCYFCGRNFEAVEGFEEIRNHRNRFIRCESCSMEQREEEYNWQMNSEGRSMTNGERDSS
ncbi:MAG: hypothetical protein JW893_06600 [Candidatus Omnitrophica bacterium]|nr:hypothetical protein [Candidatus Omnitrophota bacterium]